MGQGHLYVSEGCASKFCLSSRLTFILLLPRSEPPLSFSLEIFEEIYLPSALCDRDESCKWRKTHETLDPTTTITKCVE